MLAYFYSILSNTASMDDTEAAPDWPDEKRAELSDLPWYLVGSEGLTNTGLKISRYIEHNLDREENDFGLEVTTPDVARPITLYRQYKKNMGNEKKSLIFLTLEM